MGQALCHCCLLRLLQLGHVSVLLLFLLYQAIGALQELSRRQVAMEDVSDDTFTKSEVLRLCIGAVLLSFTASITVMVVASAFLMPRKQQHVLGARLPQKMQHV